MCDKFFLINGLANEEIELKILPYETNKIFDSEKKNV